MATTRIKDISSTVTSLASDDYIAVDGATNGTRKMVRGSIYTDVASAFTGAPTTYDICPLNSGTGKIDATYLPTSGDTPKGGWNASTNSPSLIDGTGTAGDYYDVTTAGSQDLGSGSITFTVGDVVKYDGSVWYKIDSVANFLDGYSTAATSRAALEVNSVDEDAEATGTKLVGPALYFDGSNDYLEVSDSSKLSFSSSAEFGTNSSGTWSPDDNTPALTDGTGTLNQHYRVDSGAGTVTQGASTLSIINGTATTAGQAVYYDGSVWRLKDVDDLPFTISAWVKMGSYNNQPIVSKYGATAPTREWNFYTDGSSKLVLSVYDGTNLPYIISDGALTAYEGQWIHVAATIAASGPNSSNAFSANMSGAKLYVNGAAIPATANSLAGYAGMSDTSQPVWVGRWSGQYLSGHIKDAKIFNRELTATEVAQLARGTDLGFADEWGGALGGVYTQDATPSGEWNASQGTDADEAGPIGGRSNVLKFTSNTTSSAHYLQLLSFSANKRYRVEFDYYIPSGQSNIDGIDVDVSGQTSIVTEAAPTLGAWNRVSFECVPTGTAMLILATDGGVRSFADAGGDDVMYIDGCKVTEIGTLADFRAENFDSDTGKIYDISDNAFVGTSANLPTLTGRAYPVYETGTWTPTLTFGGGSTGLTYTSQEGYYTRIGNTVFATGGMILSAKGSSTGAAAIALPYTARNTTDDIQGVSVGRGLNMASLTSAVSGYIVDNTTSCKLQDWGATGSVDLDEGNFTDTTEINISVTYQIS